MDLNALYFDHQISLIRAGEARCGDSGQHHRAAARTTARAIARWQHGLGAGAAPQWRALGQPVAPRPEFGR